MKKYAFLFCFLLFSFNSWAQIEEQLEDWTFLSVGALVGYQYQQSSLLELGVGLNLEYNLLYLSSSFSIENEFDKKITGLKGNLQLGFGDRRFAYVYGGINYISYKEKPTAYLDNVLRAEAGIYVPALVLLRSPYKHFRFNLKISYTNNSNLDPMEIEAFGRHGVNVSILLGYGIHLKPKDKSLL